MIHCHGTQRRHRAARNRVCGRALFVSALAFVLFLLPSRDGNAAAVSKLPIIERHADVSRGRATKAPHTEADQKIVDGWPMYRTDRGQAAFNAAMATLQATDVAAPSARVFKGCKNLHCHLVLPKIDKNGWIPAGRIWVAPDEYVLVVRSPRPKRRKGYRRRSLGKMKYFVFHEFHNSTRNTDVYDTISAHKRSVFVPFYLGKQNTDARGQKFVPVVQVAPYDVVSRHASNMGSRGPGVEIAKNKWEKMSTVQTKASIILARIVKERAPRLRVVHHRHKEGLPALNAYKRRLAALKKNSAAPKVRLPFSSASTTRLAKVSVPLGALISRKGVKRVQLAAHKSKPIRKTRVATAPKVNTPKTRKTISRTQLAAIPAPTSAKRVRKRTVRATVKRPVQHKVAQRIAVPAPALVSSGITHGFRPKQPTLSMNSLLESIFSTPYNP